jgi:hypothetical protein
MDCRWKKYEIKPTIKVIIDVHQLSWVYHVNYMIVELLVVCV